MLLGARVQGSQAQSPRASAIRLARTLSTRQPSAGPISRRNEERDGAHLPAERDAGGEEQGGEAENETAVHARSVTRGRLSA